MPNHNFALPVWIDLAATFLFGLTGALAAMKRGHDWIGVFALAFATAVGGGLIRDGIFISQGPPAVTKDSRYIIAVTVAAATAPLLRLPTIRFNRLIAWLDALGLGAYAVVGIEKSLGAGLSVAAAILVGVINAIGGSVLRDVLVREEPLLFKPGQFYTLAALAGCLLFVLLTLRLQMEVMPAALISIGSTFAFRVLAIRFNWKTRPVLEENERGA
ncbi:MAG: trimeric intracellular cation channel family protein [Verrucomicrobiota bacterium]